MCLYLSILIYLYICLNCLNRSLAVGVLAPLRVGHPPPRLSGPAVTNKMIVADVTDIDVFEHPSNCSAEVARPRALQRQQHFGARCLYIFFENLWKSSKRNIQMFFLDLQYFLMVVSPLKQPSQVAKPTCGKIPKFENLI